MLFSNILQFDSIDVEFFCFFFTNQRFLYRLLNTITIDYFKLFHLN